MRLVELLTTQTALAAFVALLVPCGLRAQVIGGEAAHDPAVVALVDAKGQPTCSGIVVAPEAVLTAAHCLHSGPRPRVRVNQGGVPVDAVVRWVERHPAYDPDTLRSDLALLGLSAAASARPVALRRAPLDESWLGRPVRVVGFGLEGPHAISPDGVRRARVAPIEAVEPSRIRHGPASCGGDSGGAVFAARDGEEELIAVVSSGPPACRDYGRATRVDPYADWIDGVLARNADGGVGCAARSRLTATRPALWPFLFLLLARCRAVRGRTMA